MRTSTHSYAILKVSPDAYAEIRGLLSDAGYQDQIVNVANRSKEVECIDMHGIAVQANGPRRPQWHCFGCGASGMQGNFCEQCGAGKNDYQGA